MNHGRVLALPVIFAASLALAPTAALAQQRREGAHGIHATGPARPLVSPALERHRFFPRPTIVRSFIFAPVIVYAAPPVGSMAPVYHDPPAYYPPAAYYPPTSFAMPTAYPLPARSPESVAPVAPPRPDVVEFPTGRYELRGDGIATPYTWVWIPNPPPTPPADALPTTPSPDDRPESARQSEVYRWTDEQGVVHWTDNRNAVPPGFRGQSDPPQRS